MGIIGLTLQELSLLWSQFNLYYTDYVSQFNLYYTDYVSQFNRCYKQYVKSVEPVLYTVYVK